jgi:hypothetical protein
MYSVTRMTGQTSIARDADTWHVRYAAFTQGTVVPRAGPQDRGKRSPD